MTRWLPLFLVGAAGCGEAAATLDARPTDAVSVTTAPVVTAEVAPTVHGAGRLRAADGATLSFPFGGVVARVDAVRGQRVRRGQRLAVLDAASAQAQLSAATSALEKAERDAARARVLEGTALSTAQQQDAVTGLRIAEANLQSARFQARRSALVAPADGVVVDVFVTADQTAAPGQPAITFAPDGGLEVELVLPAADALRIEPGDAATVAVGAADRTLGGHVIERAGGAGTLGGITAVVALDGDVAGLVPGLVASVDLRPAPRPLRTLPVGALAEADGDEAVVYVVSEGAAHRTPVQLAFWDGETVALREGPPEGTEVVVAGLPFVTDGAAVVVR